MKGKTFRSDFNSEVTSKIELFKKKEGLSTDSAAIKKLVTFALDIMERSTDAPPVSNRQLLEEIFAVTRENWAVACQTHTFSYPDEGVSKKTYMIQKKCRLLLDQLVGSKLKNS
ncbi:putative uncharacterized protein (plasmid) [Moritella viscosa]|nr:putative uncharacterized protein [Moritella viscosa]